MKQDLKRKRQRPDHVGLTLVQGLSSAVCEPVKGGWNAEVEALEQLSVEDEALTRAMAANAAVRLQDALVAIQTIVTEIKRLAPIKDPPADQ